MHAYAGSSPSSRNLKAKFHYAIWFEAGRRSEASGNLAYHLPASSELVRASKIPLRYLVRTIFEPASVMECGF